MGSPSSKSITPNTRQPSADTSKTMATAKWETNATLPTVMLSLRNPSQVQSVAGLKTKETRQMVAKALDTKAVAAVAEVGAAWVTKASRTTGNKTWAFTAPSSLISSSRNSAELIHPNKSTKTSKLDTFSQCTRILRIIVNNNTPL